MVIPYKLELNVFRWAPVFSSWVTDTLRVKSLVKVINAEKSRWNLFSSHLPNFCIFLYGFLLTFIWFVLIVHPVIYFLPLAPLWVSIYSANNFHTYAIDQWFHRHTKLVIAKRFHSLLSLWVLKYNKYNILNRWRLKYFSIIKIKKWLR